jgi:hypothetical protein
MYALRSLITSFRCYDVEVQDFVPTLNGVLTCAATAGGKEQIP